MSYQDRKDIDRILDWINRNKYNIDDNSSALGKLDEDLTDFSSSLTTLKGNLVSFNAKLIDFDENNTNLDEDLDKLDDNLARFTGAVGNLSERLEEFEDDLTGTGGFTDTLNTLLNYMYGKGAYDGEGHEYTYNNPSPTSLKGMLKSLREDLSGITSGDQQLAIDLSSLSEYLNGFSGTLAEFEQELSSKGIDLSSLNTGLKQLIYKLSQSIPLVTEHQGRLDDFDDLIGDEDDSASTQGNNPTMFGILNDTSGVANNAMQKGLDLHDDIHGDESDPTDTGLIGSLDNLNTIVNGDSSDPTDTGLVGLVGDVNDGLGDAQSDIGDFKVILNGDGTSQNVGLISEVNSNIAKIGDTETSGTILYDIDKAKTDISNSQSNINNMNVPNTSFVAVWLCTGNRPTNAEFETLGYTSTVIYAMPLNGGLYKLYNGSWGSTTDNLNYDECIGIMKEVPSSYKTNVPLQTKYIYETSSNKYYKYEVYEQ